MSVVVCYSPLPSLRYPPPPPHTANNRKEQYTIPPCTPQAPFSCFLSVSSCFRSPRAEYRPAASCSLRCCALLLLPLAQPAFVQRKQDQRIQSSQHHQKLTRTQEFRVALRSLSRLLVPSAQDCPGQSAAHAGYISRATPRALAASVTNCFASSSSWLSLRLDRETSEGGGKLD